MQAKLGALLVSALLASTTQAAITINIQDFAGSVLETVNGSLDLTGLTISSKSTNTQASGLNIYTGRVDQLQFNEAGAFVAYQGIAKGQIDTAKGFQGAATPYVAGDHFVFSPLDGKIALSSSYQSTLQIGASAQYVGKTLADFGLSPGSYIFETPKDRIYLSIGTFTGTPVTFSLSPASSAPEPGTWVMMIAGFGLVGAAMRRHKVAVRFA